MEERMGETVEMFKCPHCNKEILFTEGPRHFKISHSVDITSDDLWYLLSYEYFPVYKVPIEKTREENV
jgi:hypothetical protein